VVQSEGAGDSGGSVLRSRKKGERVEGRRGRRKGREAGGDSREGRRGGGEEKEVRGGGGAEGRGG
jgi:hypothetical protein